MRTRAAAPSGAARTPAGRHPRWLGPSTFAGITLVLVALSLLLAACTGFGGGQTTSTATGLTSPSEDTALPPASGAGDTNTTEPFEDPAYAAAMRSWMQAYLFNLDTTPLAIDDPTSATDEQLSAADKLAQEVHDGVAKLQAVKTPPADLKEMHDEFVASMVQLADAIDQYVAALKTRSMDQVKAVLPTVAAAQARLESVTNVLAPNVGVEIPGLSR